MERSKYNPALIFGVSEEDETAGTSKTVGTNTEDSVGSDDQQADNQHTFRRSFSEIHRNRSRQFFRSLYLKRRQFRQSHESDACAQHDETSKGDSARADQSQSQSAMNRVDIRFNITDSIDESEEINLDLNLAESFNAKSDSEALGASLSQLHTLHVDGVRTMTTSHSAPLNDVRTPTSPIDNDEANSFVSAAGSPVSNWNQQNAANASSSSYCLPNAKREQLVIEPQPLVLLLLNPIWPARSMPNRTRRKRPRRSRMATKLVR